MDSNWFYNILEWELKSIETNLMDLDWFYDILGLELKNSWTNLLDLDWFYYNQSGIRLLCGVSKTKYC